MAQTNPWELPVASSQGTPSAPRGVVIPKSQAEKAEEERQARQAEIEKSSEERAARGETRDIAAKEFSQIGSLRTEFIGIPEVKEFRQVQNATRQIIDLTSKGTPMANIGSVFSYMKILDPGSTVREGEAASAQNAAGIPDRIRNYYNQMLSGEGLSETQRNDMADVARSIYNQRLTGYNSLAETYRGLMTEQGADPDKQGITLAVPYQTEAELVEFETDPNLVVGADGKVYDKRTGQPVELNPEESNNLGQAFYAGVGDIAQGVGELAGIVGNPANAAVNALFGTNLSTDLGQTLREATGAPQGDPLASAINRAGVTGLTGVGGASLAARTLPTLASREIAATLATQPAQQIAANVGGGAAAEITRQQGGGLPAQLAATMVGGIPAAGAVNLGQSMMRAAPDVISSFRGVPQTVAQAAPETAMVADEAAAMAPRMFEAGETVTSRSAGAMGTSPEQIRLMQAEGLPVPVQLTRGAAARDPEQLAFEKEQIFSELGGPLRRRAEENNLQALQNFDRFIDMTGAEAPDVASTGNAVINALSNGYQASKNRVRTAYTAADKAGETAEMVPYNSLIDFVNQQTPTTRTTLAPILQSTVEKLNMEDPAKSGMISIRALEDVRKSINKAVQPNTPNESYGAALKELIDTSTEGVGGELYKKARQLRIDQANKFENRAIVARLVSNIKNMDDRRVPADRVFKTAILNESPENIQFLRRTLRDLGDDGKQAWSELQGATLRHIQERATANVNKTSENLDVVSAAQLNKAVDELDKNGRLDLIFNPKMAQQVRDLRDVIQYVNTVPPGTSINTSGTARTLAAALGEMVITGTTTSIPLPILTGIKVIRDQVKNAKIKKQINRSLLPRDQQD